MRDEQYPITGSVWFRNSTNEWVLELNGAIRDTSFSSRHTAPADTLPEDVPGLGHHYALIEQLRQALRSSAGPEERQNAIRAADLFLK